MRAFENRVRGTGLDRSELPNFKKLGYLPENILSELIEFFSEQESQAKNDLSTEKYEVSRNCILLKMIPDNYRQILLQEVIPEDDKSIEENYKNWISEIRGSIFKDYIDREFPNSYRMRGSFLPAGGSLDWHIDSNTSVGCRIHISLNDSLSLFEVRRRGKIDSKIFKKGEIWFVNTGWPHRVINDGEDMRLNLIFGIHYDDIRYRL